MGIWDTELSKLMGGGSFYSAPRAGNAGFGAGPVPYAPRATAMFRIPEVPRANYGFGIGGQSHRPIAGLPGQRLGWGGGFMPPGIARQGSGSLPPGVVRRIDNGPPAFNFPENNQNFQNRYGGGVYGPGIPAMQNPAIAQQIAEAKIRALYQVLMQRAGARRL